MKTFVTETRLEFEAMYAAITGRDTRFDGTFYTAVRTTGVYCRPSCPARKPHRENVDFFPSAAAAQSAGYRACRRCVPEALPGSPLWDIPGSVCARALALIDRGVVDEEGVEGLARRLGFSSRTVTRTMMEQTGAPPLAHARARRARLAHALITGTQEAFSDIAFAAGFASIRQFNDTVRAVYGVNPTQLRAARRGSSVSPGSSAARSEGAAPGTLRAVLTYRPPLDWTRLVAFFAARALPGVDEATSDGRYRLALALPHGPGTADLTDDAARNRIAVGLDLADLRDYGPACAALRRILDLDADPLGIDGHLGSLPELAARVRAVPGLRIPGTPTPLEALLRALTGERLDGPSGGAGLARPVLARSALQGLVGSAGEGLVPFPSAARILEAGPGWSDGPAGKRSTASAVLGLAAAGALDPAADPADAAAALSTVAGLDPYAIASTLVRGYGAPDVAVPGLAPAYPATLALAAPWRSYASLHLAVQPT